MANIEGMDELLKALDETALSLGQKKRLIVRALREGSVPIEEEAASRIPVLTGEARESISTTVREQTATGAEAEIGPKKFYPKFHELGTVHQDAKPWLGPAYDTREEEAVDIIGTVLGDGIEDAFNRG